MFERTIEAQALDHGSRSATPFSVAVAAHLAVVLALAVVSYLTIPRIVEPTLQPVLFLPSLLPPADPTPIPVTVAPAPAPKKGTEDAGRSIAPKPEPPRDVEVPTTTPDHLPEPAPPTSGEEGPTTGTRGSPFGRDDGIDDAPGRGPGYSHGTDLESTGPVGLTPDMVPPVLIQKTDPEYPSACRLARIQGKVVVQAVVGLDGRVESVEVLSSTNPLFDDAATRAVSTWKYRPATLAGRPVRVYFTVVVTFVMR